MHGILGVRRAGQPPDDGAFVHKRVCFSDDGGSLDLGDLLIRTGHAPRRSGGPANTKNVGEGATVRVRCPNAAGELQSRLDGKGHFQVKGLPDGLVSVSVVVPPGPGRLAYRLSPKNKCLDPSRPSQLVGQIKSDVTDLTILLEPGEQTESVIALDALDPAVVADFGDAKAGPITGVAPAP